MYTLFEYLFYTSSKKLEQSWEKTRHSKKDLRYNVRLQSMFFLLEKFTSNITCSLESGVKHHKSKQIWNSGIHNFKMAANS
jgi:hypothetical protein